MKVCIKILKMPCMNKQPFMNSGNTKAEKYHWRRMLELNRITKCENLAEMGKRTVSGLAMETEVNGKGVSFEWELCLPISHFLSTLCISCLCAFAGHKSVGLGCLSIIFSRFLMWKFYTDVKIQLKCHKPHRDFLILQAMLSTISKFL